MRFVLVILLLMAAGSGAAAQGAVLPSVPFSATAVQEQGAVRVVETIHYADGRLRIDGANGFAATILDLNTQTECLLMVNHTYLVLPMDNHRFRTYFAQSVAETDARKLGREQIAGMATTKYGYARDGAVDEGGTYWLTDSGIMVRHAYEDGAFGETRRHLDYLENLKVGPQDESLFRTPAGYRPAR